MKRIISVKDDSANKDNSTSANKRDTERQMTGVDFEKNIFKNCHIFGHEEDLVKASLTNEEPSREELDMAPFF